MRDNFRSGALREMEDCWPSSVGLLGAANHAVLGWLKTIVVRDQGNGPGLKRVGDTQAAGGTERDSSGPCSAPSATTCRCPLAPTAPSTGQ